MPQHILGNALKYAIDAPGKAMAKINKIKTPNTNMSVPTSLSPTNPVSSTLRWDRRIVTSSNDVAPLSFEDIGASNVDSTAKTAGKMRNAPKKLTRSGCELILLGLLSILKPTKCPFLNSLQEE